MHVEEIKSRGYGVSDMLSSRLLCLDRSQGKATMLQSRFRLTYTMILNLMRTSDFCVEDMMKRSFGEFGHQSQAPSRRLAEQQLQQQLQLAPELDCAVCAVDLGSLYADWNSVKKLEKELRVGFMAALCLFQCEVWCCSAGCV